MAEWKYDRRLERMVRGWTNRDRRNMKLQQKKWNS